MKKILLSIMLLSFISITQASQPIQINWQDLRGKVEPYNDPFANLTSDQLYNLSVYAQVTEMKKSVPERVTEAMIKGAEEAKVKLIEEKIDIDYLLAQRLMLIEKRQRAALVTNTLLADKTIQMSAYMLALEFDNGLVSEFLLVPTIGACSHKPVPPANQIIFVKAKTAVKAGSPYMPIKVTGKLQITPQSKDLYLVDGQKEIEMSYTLNDAIVEPHIATH